MWNVNDVLQDESDGFTSSTWSDKMVERLFEGSLSVQPIKSDKGVRPQGRCVYLDISNAKQSIFS